MIIIASHLESSKIIRVNNANNKKTLDTTFDKRKVIDFRKKPYKRAEIRAKVNIQQLRILFI
jgi:hypothetical protein